MTLSVALRPFLPADAALLAEIFRASIMELAGEDYSEAQQAEWIATADDEAAFGKRLAASLTLVASVGGAPVAFASLKGPDVIDMLYVHPGAAGQGVASALIGALEKIAGARGAKKLTVDASDTAEPLFRKLGYAAQRRNTVPLGDEWFANTTMTKSLAAEPAGTLQ